MKATIAALFLIAAGSLQAATSAATNAPAFKPAPVFGKKADEKAKRVWLDDFKAAQKAAAETGQPILALFTGTDWCPWCVKLEKEILSAKTFTAFADRNLVLFIADYPQSKRQDKKVKDQNAELKKTYGIRGYPSVLILNAEGKSLGATGYNEAGAEAFVEAVSTIMKQAKYEVKAVEAAAKPMSAYEKAKAAQAAKTKETK